MSRRVLDYGTLANRQKSPALWDLFVVLLVVGLVVALGVASVLTMLSALARWLSS